MNISRGPNSAIRVALHFFAVRLSIPFESNGAEKGASFEMLIAG
jgi:hypothetical protein